MWPMWWLGRRWRQLGQPHQTLAFSETRSTLKGTLEKSERKFPSGALCEHAFHPHHGPARSSWLAHLMHKDTEARKAQGTMKANTPTLEAEDTRSN